MTQRDGPADRSNAKVAVKTLHTMTVEGRHLGTLVVYQ